MNTSRKLSTVLLMLSVSGLISCSSATEKNFQKKAELLMPSQRDWNIAQVDAVKATKLTDLIDIKALNVLIERSMINNPDLQQTLIALKIAYAQRTSTNSDRIPELSAGFSADKDEDNDASYTTDLTISWELDLWNAIGNSTSAADKDIASNIATLQSVKATLAANIMRAWLQISLQKQLVTIEKQRLSVLEENESFILEEYRSALGDLEDLDTAKTNSASTRSTLAEYSETLAQNKRSLALLIGQLGGEQNFNISSEFPDVLIPLASLPKQDLSRRPDLQSAFFDIEAEAYRTKAAYKALLPSISLEVALTDISDSPVESLLTSPLWSLLGQLSAPIFSGGYLRSQAKIADLTTENALGQEKSLMQQFIGVLCFG